MGSEPQFEPRSKLIDLPVLQKFELYENDSYFYLIGSEENKKFRRILKIGRREQNELNLFEDPTRYTKEQMDNLKICLREGNKKAGGFKAVITCYGIIGFVTFMGPYYMLVITKRKKVGEICGHSVYSIVETRMITIPKRSIRMSVADSKTEKRCKKLLRMVDLSKDFYFSYTYHLKYSLQKNIDNTETVNPPDKNRFVWNVFLTRGIKRILKNTVWTVALVYGFFQQTKCLVSGEEFVMTLIARRSRHYAGTRYLRRGVNDIGSVANDVETEQIVSKEVPEGQKILMTSVVQMRGSIPLFWSQETSFKLQPEIILDKKKDKNLETTKLHFKELRKRYGDWIIILNLLKKGDRQRETILGEEFANAIRIIRNQKNMNDLKEIHFDLSDEHSKSGVDKAFDILCMFAKEALESTDLFFCEAPSGVGAEGVLNESDPLWRRYEEENSPDREALKADIYQRQKGVLRTNCVDCLDRTNFSQYAHGLVALAHQLHTMGITGPPVIDICNPLAINLMEAYTNMGDVIALQYGGSEAHRKLFCDLRGEWNTANKYFDKLIGVRRYINNIHHDGPKQIAINVFLGHFQPKFGDSDMQNFERIGSYLDNENLRPQLRRSLSDNLLKEVGSNLEELVNEHSKPLATATSEELNGFISEMALEFPIFETEPASLSFPSALSSEEHLRGPGSSRMFPGSSSRRPGDDRPGYANSYETSFTPAEEIYNGSRSNESNHTSESSTNSNFELQRCGSAQHGLSKEFTQWIESTSALYKVRRKTVPCT